MTVSAGAGGAPDRVLGGRGSSLPDGTPTRVCNSSRTESFIIAPQVRQIDNVGANVRLQTGQFIRQKAVKDFEL